MGCVICSVIPTALPSECCIPSLFVISTYMTFSLTANLSQQQMPFSSHFNSVHSCVACNMPQHIPHTSARVLVCDRLAESLANTPLYALPNFLFAFEMPSNTPNSTVAYRQVHILGHTKVYRYIYIFYVCMYASHQIFVYAPALGFLCVSP